MVQRYVLLLGSIPLHCERHSLDEAPSEGTVAVLEDATRRCFGQFVGGEWKRDGRKPVGVHG
jgi:hypothetical protein